MAVGQGRHRHRKAQFEKRSSIQKRKEKKRGIWRHEKPAWRKRGQVSQSRNQTMMALTTRKVRGFRLSAEANSKRASAAKHRVEPQRGQGNPVNTRIPQGGSVRARLDRHDARSIRLSTQAMRDGGIKFVSVRCCCGTDVLCQAPEIVVQRVLMLMVRFSNCCCAGWRGCCPTPRTRPR